MRLGILFGTAGLGLAACALALVPLALGHKQLQAMPVFEGTTSVYAVPFHGGAPREVMRLHGQWNFPVVTADDRALLIEHPLVPAGVQLWRVPLDGEPRTHLADVQVFSQLVWSDDRSEYISWGTNKLVVRRLNGIPVRRFGFANTVASWNGDYVAGERQSRPPSTGWRLDIEVWRANGRHVWSHRMPFPGATVSVARDGRHVADVRMHFLELVTPTSRRVLARDAAPSQQPIWTHDGRRLLYYDNAARLKVLTIATGRARVLLSAGHTFQAALSRDEKRVYVLGLNDAVSIPK